MGGKEKRLRWLWAWAFSPRLEGFYDVRVDQKFNPEMIDDARIEIYLRLWSVEPKSGSSKIRRPDDLRWSLR
jgi:hypothetical protein